MILLNVKINEDDGFFKILFKKSVIAVVATFYFAVRAAIYALFVKAVIFPFIGWLVVIPATALVPSFMGIFYFSLAVECLFRLVSKTDELSLET